MALFSIHCKLYLRPNRKNKSQRCRRNKEELRIFYLFKVINTLKKFCFFNQGAKSNQEVGQFHKRSRALGRVYDKLRICTFLILRLLEVRSNQNIRDSQY